MAEIDLGRVKTRSSFCVGTILSILKQTNQKHRTYMPGNRMLLAAIFGWRTFSHGLDPERTITPVRFLRRGDQLLDRDHCFVGRRLGLCGVFIVGNMALTWLLGATKLLGPES